MREPFDVVTGGAGFIGSHICRELLRTGRRVRVIDNLATGYLRNIGDLLEKGSVSFEFIEADIRDYGLLKKLFRGGEVIYHQAAIPSVQRSVENPIESNSANVDGTLNVFLAARETGATKVVFASSSSVYGDSERLPKEESMPVNPISPYAVAKYASELYGKVFSEIYGLACIGLRYFNVFGPGQDPASDYAAVIPRFITLMLQGKRPIIYGDGEQSRDFTYVSNVVAANLSAAASDAGAVTVNIACGKRFSLNQLVEALNEILESCLEPIYENPRPGDVRHSLADIEEAQRVIGFNPRVGFLEGLRLTTQDFRKRLDS